MVPPGIQLIDADSKLNHAWSHRLTNSEIDASQVWAMNVADFNLDGHDDVALATGFATPAITMDTRAQGSPNHLQLQASNGEFDPANAFTPKLPRASRGAATGDFNNDGYPDLVVANNNGFASLYINRGGDSRWVGFECKPLILCQGTKWSLAGKTLYFDRNQPYLSMASNRLYFGLGNYGARLQLTLTRKDGQQETRLKFEANRIYRVDLATNKWESIPEASPSPKPMDAETLFHAILTSDTPSSLASLLAERKSQDTATLVTLLQRFVSQMSRLSPSSDHRLVMTVAWLLNQTGATSHAPALLDLIMHLENRVFVDRVPMLSATLNDQQFCAFSKRLAYWFEEEEVLPETKFSLIPALLEQGLQSEGRKRLCAIDALGHAEQTTIGASLLPLLDHNQPLLAAVIVRALGRLKFAHGLPNVKQFCQNSGDPLVKVECQVSLHKFRGAAATGKTPIASDIKAFFALHSQNLLIRDSIGSDSLDDITFEVLRAGYHRSPVEDHRLIGNLALLLSGDYASLALQPNLEPFVQAARQHYPVDINQFIRMNPAPELMTHADNSTLKALLKQTLPADTVPQAIRQCVLRTSVHPTCQQRYGKQLTLARLNADQLLALPPERLYYLLYAQGGRNPVQQKVIVNQLARSEKQEQTFALLHHNRLYKQLENIDVAWLNAFLRYSLYNDLPVATDWNALSLPSTADTPWLTLYQTLKEADGH